MPTLQKHNPETVPSSQSNVRQFPPKTVLPLPGETAIARNRDDVYAANDRAIAQALIQTLE